MACHHIMNIQNVSVGARGRLTILSSPTRPGFETCPNCSTRDLAAGSGLPSVINDLAFAESEKSTIYSLALEQRSQTVSTLTIVQPPDKYQLIYSICLSRARVNGAGLADWFIATAKFHIGIDEDWISDNLAAQFCFPKRETQALKCKGFDRKIFYSDDIVDKLTWASTKVQKSISGSFRIMPRAPYDILIGKNTISNLGAFSMDIFQCGLGDLVIRKISKRRLEAKRAKIASLNEDKKAILS